MSEEEEKNPSAMIHKLMTDITSTESEELEKIITLLLGCGHSIKDMELRNLQGTGYKELWCAGTCVCSSELIVEPNKPVVYRLKPYPAVPRLA